jgi:hypothetical protein
MAAVIVRADIPVSESLVTFVVPVLSKLGSSRLLFIVTWIDAVAPEERSRTLATIRLRLSRRLGIPHPAVLELAPKAYLASLNDQAVQPETKKAADNFARRVADTTVPVCYMTSSFLPAAGYGVWATALSRAW